MADEMVRKAQQFINGVYGGKLGIDRVPETGATGWTTMFALTRALQYELGITSLSDTFGPTTLNTLQSKYPTLNGATVPSQNFAKIIQSALYCKGYDGGDIDGTYNSRVAASVTKLKQDMGVDFVHPGGNLVPKVFKGLLNMDAYITVNGGSDTIRAVQRWLNGSYVNRRDFFVIPADGHHSRDVAKSMLFAVQYELGMADGTANGVFGPGTQSGLRSHTVSSGSSGPWVQLFSAGMVLNQRPVAFTSTFTSALASAVSAFQSFVKLPVNGTGDFATWASLLVSYGDQSRSGEACDGVTLITPARAATLKAQGITYIGRYLTNPIPDDPDLPEKAIQPGELRTIADNGLRCFPIYQTFGRAADNFSYPQGRAAGQAAINAALDHGFKSGTRIFFAVDFDALDEDVTSSVLPHFKGIVDAVADDGNRFGIGVYGPRNVCTRVSAAGHATASFVSDMSSGFSGNFGYPLPENWAYDQIVTRTVGSGAGSINIDINIASGRDTGQGSFNAPRTPLPDTRLDSSVISSMQTDVGKYMESIGFPNDGGFRSHTHETCFRTVVVEYDTVITQLAYRYKMRKALIQTSAYWEMRHIDAIDVGKDLEVIAEFNTTGSFRDSSTGICQIFGRTAVLAWNHCIGRGYTEGTIRNVNSNQDKYNVWRDCMDDDQFAISTVPLIHLWNADGAPGNVIEETALRSMRLDYTESEIFQILRRYQGSAESEATPHARQRMALYQVMEKYNSISRNV
ncbi:MULTISPECIES: glycoside hydrolase domain-containing protein [unclassified Streptomyces]|uniref:glycoside hydrolase domain-containing protein n=1 Tax=unclassified Streptomyces TaxID=2593676 RepID=UPI003805B506